LNHSLPGTLVAANVRLEITTPTEAGKLPLRFHGDAGRKIEVWNSADLQAWDLVTTLTNTNGFMEYLDTATNRHHNFYRIRQVP
jgi:hypothetical protein